MKKILLIVAMHFLLVGSVANADKNVNMNEKVFQGISMNADKGDVNSQFALGGMAATPD